MARIVEEFVHFYSRSWAITVGLLVVVFALPYAMASEPQWWTDQKRACGLSSSLDYQTLTQQGFPCPARNGGMHNFQ